MPGQHRASGGRFGFGTARGRAEQSEGRHTPEYVSRKDAERGMHPLGHAGRQTLDQLHADDAPSVDRGDPNARKI